MPFDLDVRDADYRRDPERPGVQSAPGAVTVLISATGSDGNEHRTAVMPATATTRVVVDSTG